MEIQKRRRMFASARLGLVMLAAAAALGALAAAVWATPGDLDPSFGIGGIVVTDLGSWEDDSSAVAIQADGKIVVAGRVYAGPPRFAVLRYERDGRLDISFGAGGVVTASLGSSSYGNAVAIQPDGKIIVAGDADNGGYDLTLVRFESDGRPDLGFGHNGAVFVDAGSVYESAYDLAIQADGKIVVVGMTERSLWDTNLIMSRREIDGEADSTFGIAGVVTTSVSGYATSGQAMLIQPDGRIVVADSIYNSSRQDMAVLRYESDGQLDTTFGHAGIVTTSISDRNGACRALAIQPDGKLIVAGGVYDASESGDIVLVRYEDDGTLDTGFGVGGIVTSDLGDSESARNVALQSDGKIVIVGSAWVSDTMGNLLIVRYTSDGDLDAGFGTGGIVTTSIGSRSSVGRALAIQADGMIVTTGWSADSAGRDVILARYDTRVISSALVGSSLTAVGDTNIKARFVSGGPCTLAVTKTIAFPGMKTVLLPNQQRGDPGEMPMYWAITHDCTGTYDVELVLCYTDAELYNAVDVTEDGLRAFRHLGGEMWTPMGGTLTAGTSCVTITGVTELGQYWTLGDSSGGQPGPAALTLSSLGTGGTPGVGWLALVGGCLLIIGCGLAGGGRYCLLGEE